MQTLNEILKSLLDQVKTDDSCEYEQLSSMLKNLFDENGDWKTSHSLRILGKGLYASTLKIQAPDTDFEHYLTIEVESKLNVDDSKLEISEIKDIQPNMEGVHTWDDMQQVEHFSIQFSNIVPDNLEDEILQAIQTDAFKQILIKVISAEIF